MDRGDKMNLQPMIDSLPEQPLSEVMRERAERKEGQNRRIAGYEAGIETHLRVAEAWIRTIRYRVKARREHEYVEACVDRACERLGAVETGYELLLKEIEGA